VGFLGELAGEADLDAVGEWERSGAGDGDFAGAADPADAGVEAGAEEGIVQPGEVADVLVGIDVGGFESAGEGVVDLSAEFIGGFLAGGGGAEFPEEFGEGAEEMAGVVGDAAAGGEGPALGEIEVDADAEGGGLSGEIDGAVAVGHVGHEGGGGENAIAVGAEDAVGDLAGEAEVVCVHDQSGHSAEYIRVRCGRPCVG